MSLASSCIGDIFSILMLYWRYKDRKYFCWSQRQGFETKCVEEENGDEYDIQSPTLSKRLLSILQSKSWVVPLNSRLSKQNWNETTP